MDRVACFGGSVRNVLQASLAIAVQHSGARDQDRIGMLGGGVEVLDQFLGVTNDFLARLEFGGEPLHIGERGREGLDILGGKDLVQSIQRLDGSGEHGTAARQQIRQGAALALQQRDALDQAVASATFRLGGLQQDLGRRARADLNIVDPGDALRLQRGV